VVTSMMTPPLSISASPLLTRMVPVSVTACVPFGARDLPPDSVVARLERAC
jgi:hypothetical protein